MANSPMPSDMQAASARDIKTNYVSFSNPATLILQALATDRPKWRQLCYGAERWLGVSVVERRSLIGELSLVCTGPTADG